METPREKNLDEKGGREPNMNENLYNEKHKLTNEKQKLKFHKLIN
jgi:hypothetical protein